MPEKHLIHQLLHMPLKWTMPASTRNTCPLHYAYVAMHGLTTGYTTGLAKPWSGTGMCSDYGLPNAVLHQQQPDHTVAKAAISTKQHICGQE